MFLSVSLCAVVLVWVPLLRTSEVGVEGSIVGLCPGQRRMKQMKQFFQHVLYPQKDCKLHKLCWTWRDACSFISGVNVNTRAFQLGLRLSECIGLWRGSDALDTIPHNLTHDTLGAFFRCARLTTLELEEQPAAMAEIKESVLEDWIMPWQLLGTGCEDKLYLHWEAPLYPVDKLPSSRLSGPQGFHGFDITEHCICD